MRNGKLFPIVNDRFHSLKKSKLISEKDCFSRTKLMHHISTGNCCIKISYTRFWFRTRNAISSADPSILRRIFEYIFFIFVCPFNSISSMYLRPRNSLVQEELHIDSSLLRSCLYYVSSAALLCVEVFSASQAAAAQSSVHSTSRPACVI